MIIVIILLLIFVFAASVGGFYYYKKTTNTPPINTNAPPPSAPYVTPYAEPAPSVPYTTPYAEPTPVYVAPPPPTPVYVEPPPPTKDVSNEIVKDIVYVAPQTFNPDEAQIDIVAVQLSGVGGNCPCDSTGWCGPDGKCYETCHASGKCSGAEVPRKNIYSCDYDPCKIVPVQLSGVGGNCPCDSTGWCGPDGKCYEYCYASGKCSAAAVPRKNTYSCDYDACKMSGPGGDCPCDPNIAWCGSDGKCYEYCRDRGTCSGNSVPRINTYSCDYSSC